MHSCREKKLMAEQYSELVVLVPPGFHELAKLFSLPADHLAFSILHYFADHPEQLYLVSRDPRDARQEPNPAASS